MGVYCCCLHVKYIVYEHFDSSLHVQSSDPTYVQYVVVITPFGVLLLVYKANVRGRVAPEGKAL